MSTAEIIQPTSREHWLALRAEDLTSSEVAALFGLSPYLTPYELFFRKRDRLIVELENAPEHIKWGNRLESAIAHGIAEDNGWQIRPKKEYMRLPELRMGASFDFQILGEHPGDLEIKNVMFGKFRDEWKDDEGNIEAPPHIELQVQHQLAVDETLEFAQIGALVGGNQVAQLRREREEKVIATIKEAVRRFWEMVARNEPPPPDFREDAAFIFSQYRHARPGSIMEVRHDPHFNSLVDEYEEAKREAARAEERKKAANAELLTYIGDHEKVLGDGYTISCKTVERDGYVVKPCSYRDWRINWRKAK